MHMFMQIKSENSIKNKPTFKKVGESECLLNASHHSD